MHHCFASIKTSCGWRLEPTGITVGHSAQEFCSMRAANFSQDAPKALVPEELGIACLARRTKSIAESAPEPGKTSAMRVIVGLRRCTLDVDDHAMYFRLKMALVRTIRRSFRRAIIEVDDLDEPTSAKAFEVILEPADAALQKKADTMVARVIRWRRWCIPASDTGIGADE